MAQSYGIWISAASFQKMSTVAPHSRPHYKLEKHFFFFQIHFSWLIDLGAFVGEITSLLLTTLRPLHMWTFYPITLGFLLILPIADSPYSLQEQVKSIS